MNVFNFLSRSKATSLFAFALLFANLVFQAQNAYSQPDGKVYIPEQVLLNQRLERPVRARIVGQNCYVLDSKSHRLVELDSQERFVRQIGRLGSGPQELKDPTDFAINQDGKIYVFEAGNKRLTILGPDGVRVGGFSTREVSLAVALNSKGEVILNQPSRGTLLTVYTPTGQAISKIGNLQTPPSSFKIHAGHDPNEVYNRLHLALDKADNIYVAWWYQPRVQKYSASGELVWDIELTGKHVEFLKQRAKENTGYYKYDGATVIQSGISYYKDSVDLVFVLFPSRGLVVLNNQGKQVGSFFDTREGGWPFNSITATEDGKLVFTDTFQGVYSVAIPKL